MIKFPCKCGHPFELAMDMAGGLVQCPKCGLLNDVPGLDDLDNIADDGTFLVDETIDLLPPDSAADLARVFTNKTTDAFGEEKDLRLKPDDLELVGLVPEEVPEDYRAVKPKYDPETGELVRLFEIKPDDKPPLDEIPIAQAAISYATGDTRHQVTLKTVFTELFMPANVVVLFIVLIMQVLAGAVKWVIAIPAMFFGMPLQILNFMGWAMIAHYGCVIEDIGPDGRDELPRPGRHLAIGEDLWGPFIRMVGSLFICYAPARLAAHFLPHESRATVAIVILLELIGTVFLPAVMLTNVTSGSPENLRPDRVIGVMRVSGIQYALSVLLWTLAFLPTSLLWLGQSQMLTTFTIEQLLRLLSHVPGAVWLLVLITVYLMHLYCWHLGLLYREHHDEFPWVLQRHVPTRAEKQKQIAEIMAAKARQR